MQRNLKTRLEALEGGLPPLQRAERLIAQRVPFEQWPDEELNAYAGQHPELELLTMEELEQLIAAPNGTQSELLVTLLAGHGWSYDDAKP